MVVFGCGDFDLFLRFVPQQDPISSTYYFGGEGLQIFVVWGVPPADVLLAVARSRCKQQVIFAVFKVCMVMAFASIPFPCFLFQCFFQAPMDDE